MFGDHFAPARQLLATLQSLVGPTREMNDVENATTRGQWEHRGEYRGRPIGIQLTHRYTSQAVGRLLGVELRAPFGGRPVELMMDFAPLVPGQPPAPLPDNAGSLFPHGLVTGHPQEVVRAAFDPTTTSLVNATIGPKGLRVTSSGDWLTVFVPVAEPPTPPPDAAELARMLDFVFTLAGRLVTAFDQAHEAAVRAGGPQGGARWLASQQAARNQRTAERQRSTTIAIAVAAAVMIAIVVIIIAIVAVAC